MTSGVSWEVEGIPQEARDAALDAARRSGMSVGEWLDSVINGRGAGADAPRREDDIAEVKGRLAEVGRQLDQLSRLNTQSFPRPNLHADEHPRELADAIWKLDRRIDQLIGGAHAPARPGDAGAHRNSANAGNPGNVGSPLEQALIEIAERQRALDVDGRAPTAPPLAPSDEVSHAPTQSLAQLEERLRAVTTRIETFNPGGVNAMVETLRDDLAEIGLMVKDAAPRQAIEALEAEVRRLAERLAASASHHDAAGVQQGLAEVRDALRSLTPAEGLLGVDSAVRELSRKIELVPTHVQDPAAMEQLEGAIASLRGVTSQVASDGAMTKLTDEVHELAAKVERISSSNELLTRLDERISSLATALEGRAEPAGLGVSQGIDQAIGQGVGHGTDGLESMIRGLTDRIEEFARERQDGAHETHQAAFAAAPASDIGDRISALADKLDSSNARLDHLEPIERALGDLLVYLEREQSPAEPLPEVNSLRQDVRDTRSSIESMRGALDHLIDRFAGIENDIRRPSPLGALSAPMASLAAPVAQPARPEALAAALPPLATAQAATAASAQSEHRVLDPSLPPDHPLEPGALRGRAAAPSERIAASEAALGALKPAAAADPGSKASFIAAARRAAQAANGESVARPDKPAVAAKEAPKVDAKLETKTKVAAKVTAAKAPKAAGRGWGARVRSFLVAASVVAIVLSSLHLVASLFQSADEAAPPETQSVPTEAPPTPPTPASAPTAPSGRQSLNAPADTPAVTSGQADATASGDVTGSIGRAATPPAASDPALSAPANTADRLPSAIGGVLRAAAAKGDAAAEFEIGQRYAEGRGGVSQNLPEAAWWYDLAAQQGLVLAEFRLGGLYEKGFGVKKDLDAARKLYLAAADAGNAKAMHNLAVLYAEGIDGKPDYQNAAKWFRKGADYGLSDSQYNLGILFGRGIGMPVNLTEAYKWFALAARDGDHEAAAKRDEVAARLDQASLAAAKAAVQAWTAMPQPEAATQAAIPPGGWDAPAPAPAASAKPRHTAAAKPQPPTALH
jgi:localization factor PodJL